jgi:hypothetical protein
MSQEISPDKNEASGDAFQNYMVRKVRGDIEAVDLFAISAASRRWGNWNRLANEIGSKETTYTPPRPGGGASLNEIGDSNES